MVTRTIVRISPEERAAAAAEETSRDDGRTDYDDKHDNCETIQLCSFQGCQKEAASLGGICNGHSYNDLFYGCKPSDGTSDDDDEESFRHNNTAAGKKRPCLKDDAGGTKKTKRRKVAQKFIDLTDVPPQSPILRSHDRGGTSKYHGVSFHKPSNKWRAQIGIDKKMHLIGYYDNEEEAAVDYARAMKKYRGEHIEEKQKSTNGRLI